MSAADEGKSLQSLYFPCSYNSTKPVPGPYRFGQILVKRATVKGFIVLDYVPRFAEAMRDLSQWLKEGKIKYRVDGESAMSCPVLLVVALNDPQSRAEVW